MDHIIPFGALPQVYLYEHPQAEEDGVLECPAIVVMRRAHGFMAALPSGVFSDPELAEGAEAGMEALVGPSLQIQVSAALLTEEGPIPQPGVSLPCLLVDFSAQAAARFAPLGPGSDPEALLSFDAEAPDTIPEPSGLLQQALVWAQRPDLVPERVAFYSAEEEAPAPRKVLRLSRQDVPKGGGGQQAAGHGSQDCCAPGCLPERTFGHSGCYAEGLAGCADRKFGPPSWDFAHAGLLCPVWH